MVPPSEDKTPHLAAGRVPRPFLIPLPWGSDFVQVLRGAASISGDLLLSFPY